MAYGSLTDAARSGREVEKERREDDDDDGGESGEAAAAAAVECNRELLPVPSLLVLYCCFLEPIDAAEGTAVLLAFCEDAAAERGVEGPARDAVLPATTEVAVAAVRSGETVAARINGIADGMCGASMDLDDLCKQLP